MAIYQLVYSNICLFAQFLWHEVYLPHAWLLTAGALTAISIVYIVYYLYFAPLSKIPGSTLSKFTQAKMGHAILTGTWSDVALEDYFRYGDIYRAGPNVVIINNPADCRAVLATHRFAKSDMYKAFALVEESMFSTHSATLSDMRRRQIGPAFTHASLNAMEPTILECGIHAVKAKWDKAIAESTTPGSATVYYALHFSKTT
ncbi:hypothetical protein GGH95_005036, partial [Coemansia sp. RSA 1836]